MTTILMLDGLTPVQKLVLVKIAQHSDDAGAGAWPSYATLATAACCDRRHAMRIVDSLVAAGWLTKQSRGPCRSNTYALVIAKLVTPAPPAANETASQLVVPVSPDAVVADDAPSDMQTTTLVVPVSPPGGLGVTPLVVPMSPDLPMYLPSDLPVDLPSVRAAVFSGTTDQSPAVDRRTSSDRENEIGKALTKIAVRWLQHGIDKGYVFTDGDLAAAIRCRCDTGSPRLAHTPAAIAAAITNARRIMTRRLAGEASQGRVSADTVVET